MSNIQKKTLQHVSSILKSVDSYPTYSELNNKMTEAGIDNDIKLKILAIYQSAISIEFNKVKDANGWIEALIDDIQ